MPRTRAKRDEPPPRDEAAVVRGLLHAAGLGDGELRDNAALNHDLYGFYGISVWLADGPRDVESLERTKLRKFDRYAVFTAADLRERDLRLWPTGQAPHYDVVYGDGGEVAALVERLLGAPYVVRVNRHVDREEH